MAEVVSGGGGSKLPQSFGEKLAFSVPVIIVTFVLSVAVAVVILLIVDGKTREELKTQIGRVDKNVAELKGDLDKTQSELKDSEAKVAALQEKTDALAKDHEEVKTSLNKTQVDVAEAKLKLANQEKINAEQKGALTETKSDVSKLDNRIVYVEDKLKKLDEIEKDVLNLKGDTAGLKKEYQVLTQDLNDVRTKADVTEKDLVDLGERARQFQMRVLLARAREAAEYARTGDLKSLLQRLEDVEGGK